MSAVQEIAEVAAMTIDQRPNRTQARADVCRAVKRAYIESPDGTVTAATYRPYLTIPDLGPYVGGAIAQLVTMNILYPIPGRYAPSENRKSRNSRRGMPVYDVIDPTGLNAYIRDLDQGLAA
jgi:hypothetical protein